MALDMTHPVCRGRYLRELDARAGKLGDNATFQLLELAERDLVAAEEDLDQAKAIHNEADYRRTHAADGRERTMSAEGREEVGEAGRRVAEALEIWEDCKAYRDELASEIDSAYRLPQQPPFLGDWPRCSQ